MLPFRAFLAPCFALAACGGAASPPLPAKPSNPAPSAVPPQLTVESELGQISEAATQTAFRALHPQFLQCQRTRAAALEVLTGQFQLFLRIGKNGRVLKSALLDSTIGDIETETCILHVAIAATWPKPEGGEAEVRATMDLPELASRPAVDWPANKVDGLLEPARSCKQGYAGTYQVTAYVQQEGDGGRAIAVGVAANEPGHEPGHERAAACIVAAVKGIPFPSPGSWYAKVTFRF
ncbi:MAG: hypothetical protein WCI05_14275 [Myxococcales bacterium]